VLDHCSAPHVAALASGIPKGITCSSVNPQGKNLAVLRANKIQATSRKPACQNPQARNPHAESLKGVQLPYGF